jgi:TonB family protein
MKTHNDNSSFLATSSKKFFKVGLAASIFIAIVAFKLPIYGKTPKISFAGPTIEEKDFIITYVTPESKNETKTFNTEVITKAPVINIIKSPMDPPPIVEPITPIDPGELTSETRVEEPAVPEVPKTYLGVVEKMPQFLGGDAALLQYLRNKLLYPAIALDQELEGKVYVRFTVDYEGNINNVSIAKGEYKVLNDEALRVVKNMPKWTPGEQNGKKVNVVLVLPVNFEIL